MAITLNGTTGITLPDAGKTLSTAGDTMTGALTINASGNDQFRLTDGTQNLYLDTDSNGVAIAGGPGQTLGGVYLHNSVGNVSLFTNNALRMTVDTAGRVTMPYQPLFQGYFNSIFEVASGSPTKITSSIGVNYNVGGHWSNYRFTCPVSGVYEVHTGFMKQTGTTQAIHLDVSINGQGGNALRRLRSWEGTGYFYVSNTWLVNLSANDYIEFFAYTGSTGQEIYSQHSSLYIKLIG